jgi:hypothetical protein
MSDIPQDLFSISNQNEALKRYIANAFRCETYVNNILRERTVEIVSDFNDQPFGRSKKSLKGKRFKVKSACLSLSEGEIHLWLDGCQCAAVLWTDARLIE